MLSATATVIPGARNVIALPTATGSPKQAAFVKIRTVVPALAMPLTSGVLSLAVGSVPVTIGTAGAAESST